MSTAFPSLPTDAAPDAYARAVVQVEHDRARVVLTRAGRPVAALVPIEDMKALEALEDAHDAQIAAAALARWEAEGRPPGATLQELAARWNVALDDDAE